MNMDLQQLIAWISFGSSLIAKGQQAVADVRAAAVANGVEADWALLDKAIIDAERRKAVAHADAHPEEAGGQ